MEHKTTQTTIHAGKLAKIRKAMLINPPTGLYIREDRCQTPIQGQGVPIKRAPMDLAMMAAMLEQIKVECKLIDYPVEGGDFDTFERDIKEFSPDLLVMSVTSPTLPKDLKCATIAKKTRTDIVTLAKGADFFQSDKRTLEEYKDLDIVIRGEYEFAVQEIGKGNDLSSVLGVTFRGEDGKPVRNKERPLIENLDVLPFPARHLMKNELYPRPDTGTPTAVILTQRGCPGECVYCLVSAVSGKRIHSRSPESVVAEIEECVYKHGIRDFFFRADTFTWLKPWVIKLCKLIIEKNLKITWVCNSRVDTLDDERVEWMKKAGCWLIAFGIESGNQEMLDNMKKYTKLDTARNAIKICKKHGVKTYNFFVLGLPWESKQTAEQTMKFAQELDSDFVDFSIAYPFPGTELWDIVQDNGLMKSKDIYGFSYDNPVTHTFHLTNDELVAIKKKALMSYYLRPKYIARTLWANKSPKILANYLRYGFSQMMFFLKLGSKKKEAAA
ncbi:MAG: radical SAM protein [Nanoarchaeota archaeon]